MSLPQAQFQIPEGYREYPKPTTPIENEVPFSNNFAAENSGSIDRETVYYAKSAEIALENEARLRERQAIIIRGTAITEARQAELEERLNVPKPSVARRVFRMMTSGQLDSSAFRIKPVSPDKVKSDAFRQLLNHESSIGSALIEQPPLVSQQEFFLSDEHSNEWFLHMQSSINPNQSRTIRYAVYETEGIVKSVDGGPYQHVTGDELSEFVELTKIYYQKMAVSLYKNHMQSDYDTAA